MMQAVTSEQVKAATGHRIDTTYRHIAYEAIVVAVPD